MASNGSKVGEPRQPLLRIEHVDKRYEGTCALADVSLSVAPGEVHALVGENGAGKSTLGKIIAGAIQPDSAQTFWQGEAVHITSPIAAQQLGIGIVFQELDIFPDLSVAENIVIGNLQVERRQYVSWRETIAFCRPFLEQVGLRVHPKTRAGDLRMGEMQLAAIARALSFRARLIVLDEPTSSLADDAVQRLFSLMRQLKSSGVSFVYVSHKMKEILEIADRVTVLRDGVNVRERDAKDTSVDEIIGLMVGRKLAERPERVASQTGEIVLRVEGLKTAVIRQAAFDLRRGEVLGVAGLVGSGRSELGSALFGLDPIRAGSIFLNGRAFHPRSPRHAMQSGFGLLPGDRKLEGLMPQMSVRENTTIASLKSFHTMGFVDFSKEQHAIGPIHRRIRLHAASETVAVDSLSGGNQQKVLFSRWLLANPDVLFLDDPSRGVDIAAKQDIYGLIEALAREGKAIIFVSSELPELLANCHRILVMCEGRSTGVLDARTATQEEIMALATLRESLA